MSVEGRKITFVSAELDPRLLEIMGMDSATYPEVRYRVDRTIRDLWSGEGMYFDIPTYLRRLQYQKGRQIEVLDAGCGKGRMLGELKNGTPAYHLFMDEQTKPHYFRYVEARIPADPGLGRGIRTTGVTLTYEHVEFAEENGFNIDEAIVGPIEQHTFDRQYDFIIDYAGPTFNLPQRAIPVYSKILSPDGLILVRAYRDVDGINEDFEQLVRRNGLRVYERTSQKYLLCRSDKTEGFPEVYLAGCDGRSLEEFGLKDYTEETRNELRKSLTENRPDKDSR